MILRCHGTLVQKVDNIDYGNTNNTIHIHILALLVCFWQGLTIKMMYGIVARELKDMQMVDLHPLHYLNFYCLGNREDIFDNTDKVMEISF